MLRVLILILAMLIAQTVRAKDEACTDGVNCLCDQSHAGHSHGSVVLCEDFENAAMDDGTGTGWGAAGYANIDGTSCPDNSGNPSSPADEGTEANDCFNIVTESGCDGNGPDCVFQGTRSLGEKYDTGFSHGAYGVKSFTPQATFGVTYVFKYSTVFQTGLPGPGWKPTEWNGEAQSFIVGQNVNSCNNGCTIGGSCDAGWSQKHSSGTQYLGSTGIDLNWETRMFWDIASPPSVSGVTVAKGRICEDNSTVMYWAPFGSDFEGGSFSWTQGTWACIRTKWTGMATANSRIEQWWMDEGDTAEQKVIDIGCADPPTCSTLNLDTRGAGSDLRLNAIRYNNFYNGGDGQGSGYCTDTGGGGLGCSRAYRFADNYIVTSGDPVPCSEVGLGVAADTWTVTFSLVNPSTCTQGSCSDFSNVNASAVGTGACTTGPITWEIDSDCDSGNGLTYVSVDSVGSGAACTNSTSCTRADVCDYSAKTPGTYTATIRSTRTSCAVSDTETTTFQVLSPPQGPGNNASGKFTITDLLKLFENPYGRNSFR